MTDLSDPAMVLRLQAMALEMPHVSGHPNRHPFSGVLTRVGKPSDSAPHGSNGKKILMTYGAAERALPSLLGMGVNLTTNLDGHDPKAKIGLITSAHIEGDALMIQGFIYAADFPTEALRIQMTQADLGFSFEAQRLMVESVDTDPLVITDCYFTGASILLKNTAAYQTTAIAAAAAEKKERDQMDAELRAALTDIVAAGIKPVADAQAVATERLAAMEQSVASINQRVEANAAIVAKVEPIAKGLEVQAAALEGVGAQQAAEHFRVMANTMRIDAARGVLPSGIHASQPQQHQGFSEPPPKMEDSDAFKALKAQMAQQVADREAADKIAADKSASLETQIADLKAAALAAKPGPERKTMSPQITAVLAKAGIDNPGEDTKLTVAQIDKALEGMPMSQRMQVKGNMLRQNMVSDGTTVAR